MQASISQECRSERISVADFRMPQTWLGMILSSRYFPVKSAIRNESLCRYPHPSEMIFRITANAASAFRIQAIRQEDFSGSSIMPLEASYRNCSQNVHADRFPDESSEKRRETSFPPFKKAAVLLSVQRSDRLCAIQHREPNHSANSRFVFGIMSKNHCFFVNYARHNEKIYQNN